MKGIASSLEEFNRTLDSRSRRMAGSDPSQLQPDLEFNVTAEADGFKPASRKLSIAEGKTEEITLVLEPNEGTCPPRRFDTVSA